MDRQLLAFLAAFIAVPVLVAAYFSMGGLLKSSDYGVIVFTSSLISFGAVAFLGVPAFLFLRARKWTAFWIAPLAGFVVAVVAWWVFLLVFAMLLASRLSALFELDRGMLQEVLWPVGSIGAVVGILVWLIARPDRNSS